VYSTPPNTGARYRQDDKRIQAKRKEKQRKGYTSTSTLL
jgi:hypothetical protein